MRQQPRQVEALAPLQKLEARLRLLAEAVGRVVGRQQLFAQVWGPSFYGDERALDVYIRMIRKKIEPDPSRPIYLHTVRGVGYRLAEERPTDDCSP